MAEATSNDSGISLSELTISEMESFLHYLHESDGTFYSSLFYTYFEVLWFCVFFEELMQVGKVPKELLTTKLNWSGKVKNKRIFNLKWGISYF